MARALAELLRAWPEPFRDSQTGGRHVDKLVKLRCLDGGPQILLVHIALQSQRELLFPRRVYDYNHGLTRRFDLPVLTLVVLADMSLSWRPTCYETKPLGYGTRFEFAVCKFLDFGEDELEQNTNPVAVVILAHRAAQKHRGDPLQLRAAKWHLTRRLYERGWDRQRVRQLYRFIDWLLRLPEEMDVEFRDDLIRLEQEKAMPYITQIEERGIEKGLQQGLQQGREEGLLQEAREAVGEVLKARFGRTPRAVNRALALLDDLPQIRQLLRQAATTPSVHAFLDSLPKR